MRLPSLDLIWTTGTVNRFKKLLHQSLCVGPPCWVDEERVLVLSRFTFLFSFRLFFKKMLYTYANLVDEVLSPQKDLSKYFLEKIHHLDFSVKFTVVELFLCLPL